jgi:type I restriction enzyme M protein
MNADIRRKLDHITNVLWAGGVSNPISYIEQISYLIFLKLLDEHENEIELQGRLMGDQANGNNVSLYPRQAKRYRWSEWRFKSGTELRDFLRDDVFKYMANLVKEDARVAEYFRDAVLEITDPNVLKQVIEEIDTIQFSKMGPDIKGDIFEYLLTHLGQAALNGQFRTPRQIRAFMTEMVDPDFGDTIFDPAFGTGGFLIDAAEYILAKYSSNPQEIPIYGEDWLEKRGQTLKEAKKEIPNLQTYRKGPGEKLPDWGQLEKAIYGYDVSRQLTRIAMMNLILHGMRQARIKRANTLSEMGGLTEDDLRRQYKVILTNPPFAGTLPKDSLRDDLPTNSKKSELLFLGVIMKSLAPGGRAAVVVPEGALFGSTGAHTDLRRQLLEDYEVQAVVSLPAGVFKPYAGVKTAVIVFRNPTGKKKADKVWFYEIRNDGYDPDKISGGGRPETPAQNDIPGLMTEWEKYRKSGFKTPPGPEGNTILEAGSEEPKCWWVSLDALKDNEWNLAAGRFKPTVQQKRADEDPAELIRGVLGDEKELVYGLERLLKDVEAAG